MQAETLRTLQTVTWFAAWGVAKSTLARAVGVAGGSFADDILSMGVAFYLAVIWHRWQLPPQ